ncbi:MAG: hypothetical protein LBH20_05165 [Treponema sp.]|jgi:hypothetical protein|nr:hypothetical protein [Treponema sp.]
MPVKRLLSMCCISFFFLLSCGLEVFYYIDYIPQSDMDTTVRATIRLPSPSSDNGYSNYFEKFIIFYRIYISDILETADIASTVTNDVFNKLINASLNSDFANLYSNTDKTTTDVPTANLENTFYTRKYFLLTLEGANIDSILGTGSLGGRLEIYFPPIQGVKPTLILNGNSYVLQRAKDGQGYDFDPQPDRYFLNHEDLCNTAYAADNRINPDVATNTKPGVEFRYTYVSMYIAAAGKSLEPLPRTIYSQPTFIGIFKLADKNF